MALSSSVVTVGTTPTLIGTPGAGRGVLAFCVPAGGAQVYVGGSNVTTTNGVPLTAGTPVWMTSQMGSVVAGETWYAIVASGTQALNIVEETR